MNSAEVIAHERPLPRGADLEALLDRASRGEYVGIDLVAAQEAAKRPIDREAEHLAASSLLSEEGHRTPLALLVGASAVADERLALMPDGIRESVIAARDYERRYRLRVALTRVTLLRRAQTAPFVGTTGRARASRERRERRATRCASRSSPPRPGAARPEQVAAQGRGVLLAHPGGLDNPRGEMSRGRDLLQMMVAAMVGVAHAAGGRA